MTISDEKWERIETIFHAAVELEPVARGSYLAEACRTSSPFTRSASREKRDTSSKNMSKARRCGNDWLAGGWR